LEVPKKAIGEAIDLLPDLPQSPCIRWSRRVIQFIEFDGYDNTDMRVSVIFTTPQDFVDFYHKGLPRFYLSLPFSEAPSLPDEEVAISDEGDAEVKMVTVMEIPEEDIAAFEAVIQSFKGRVVSSDELDAMGI